MQRIMKRRKRGSETEGKSSTGSARVAMSSRSVIKSSNSSVLSPNAIMLIVIPAISLGVYALLVNMWEIYSGYTLIHEPIDLPFIMKEWNYDHSNQGAMKWSSYKPNVYTSMQHTVPESVSVGFAWFVQREGSVHIHHDCITECLSNHWTKHDGLSFGHQTIHSNEGYFMKSEFISTSQPGSGDTWTLRVTAEPLMKMQKSYLSLIVYVYNSGRGQMDLTGNIEKGMVEEIFGHTPDMKEYRMHFPYKFLTKNTAYSFLRGHLEPESNVTHFLSESLVRQSPDKLPPLHLLPSSMSPPTKNINFIAYQITSLLVVPIEMDTVFESGMYSAALSISGKQFSESSQIRHANFDQKFENTFKLLSKGFTMENAIMCKTILSDLLGSIKYSYVDTIRVKTADFFVKDRTTDVEYFPFPLLATVSPNGKDNNPEHSITTEGFLQLLVLRWNPNITKVIIAHWLDTMNINGWIPGQWHVGGVNTELDTDIASAPSLFLTLESLLVQMERTKEMDYSYIRNVFTRLEIWFNWYNETQSGVIPGTYKWRGRQEQPKGLNPETPSSGMWDYPRSSDHTHPMEYHLDLRCWVTVGIRLLARLAQLVNEALYRGMTDAKKLDQLHWDNKQRVFSDYGYYSSNAKTTKTKAAAANKGTETNSLRHIGSVGYVSLFPLMFMILSPDSSRLGYALKQIQDASLLWSQYGLRSLAKNDHLYHKSNIPNGSYSWRGPVHIHVNYLLLKALRHYGNHPGPYADIASKTYSLLRKNVIDAVVKEYSRTGYTWSCYNDKTGHGMGSSNSGLSSLILLIMSEMF